MQSHPGFSAQCHASRNTRGESFALGVRELKSVFFHGLLIR
jgi:hypothetical protein